MSDVLACCGICRFWRGGNDSRVSLANCRRFPPHVDGGRGANTIYPRTLSSDWCGEWKGSAEVDARWDGTLVRDLPGYDSLHVRILNIVECEGYDDMPVRRFRRLRRAELRALRNCGSLTMLRLCEWLHALGIYLADEEPPQFILESRS